MVTIITEPSLDISYRLKKSIKNFIKKHLLKKDLPKYSGHYAVVRSLLDGFEKINHPHNYNPTSISECYDHVHVLANVNALRMAIQLKKAGKIKRLTAGPNIVISSADEDGVVGAKEIDKYFVNSDWTISAYVLDNPRLEGKIDKWPAGVDEHEWKIEKRTTEKPVALFYKKRPEYHIYEHCMTSAKKAGYEIIEIICGSFSHSEFKEVLTIAEVAVFFVEQESQGIALQEIWATDTPTYVWNPEIWMYKGVNYACTSAPYLTEKTGTFFRTNEDFDELIKKPVSSTYEPRKWVLENMTDVICAKNFIEKTTSA